MNSLKLVLKKVHDIFPYFYFSGICLLFFSQHFTLAATGPLWWWSAIIMLLLALLFLIPLRYQFKKLDLILGVLTLCWSIWMLLALVSDINRKSDWALDQGKLIFGKCFVLINFYFAIILLIKKPQPSESKQNKSLDWIAMGMAIALVITFHILMKQWEPID